MRIIFTASDLLFGFLSIGPPEMIVILVMALLLFGRRLPEVGRTVGRSLVQFRREMSNIEQELDRAVEDRPNEQEKE